MKRNVKAPRKRPPTENETQILVQSRRRCALCFHLNGDLAEKIGQVAHLDGDRTNGVSDNLAFMCMAHHSQYDSTTSQHKNYTLTEVKAARALLYQAVEMGVVADAIDRGGKPSKNANTFRQTRFELLQSYVRDLVGFKSSVGQLLNKASQEGSDVVALISSIGDEQGKLFQRYLVSRVALDPDLLSTAESARELVASASTLRSRAQSKDWLGQNMKQALTDREAYERAFDSFVAASWGAFETQAQRLMHSPEPSSIDGVVARDLSDLSKVGHGQIAHKDAVQEIDQLATWVQAVQQREISLRRTGLSREYDAVIAALREWGQTKASIKTRETDRARKMRKADFERVAVCLERIYSTLFELTHALDARLLEQTNVNDRG